MQQGHKHYGTFAEFYPFYLGEHQNRICRRMHFTGSCLVLLIGVLVLVTANWLWLLALPVVGYGFAWAGHFLFEHNKPATFRYPVYSFIGDWVMFRDIITGRIPL